jgi:hypothetical protein
MTSNATLINPDGGCWWIDRRISGAITCTDRGATAQNCHRLRWPAIVGKRPKHRIDRGGRGAYLIAANKAGRPCSIADQVMAE